MKKRGIESYGQGQGENTVTSSETFGKGQGWNTVFNRESFGEGQGRINAAIAYWYKICKKVIDNGHYLQQSKENLFNVVCIIDWYYRNLKYLTIPSLYCSSLLFSILLNMIWQLLTMNLMFQGRTCIWNNHGLCKHCSQLKPSSKLN